MKIMIMFNDEEVVQIETDFAEKPSHDSRVSYEAGLVLFGKIFDTAVKMAYDRWINRNELDSPAAGCKRK